MFAGYSVNTTCSLLSSELYSNKADTRVSVCAAKVIDAALLLSYSVYILYLEGSMIKRGILQFLDQTIHKCFISKHVTSCFVRILRLDFSQSVEVK